MEISIYLFILSIAISILEWRKMSITGPNSKGTESLDRDTEKQAESPAQNLLILPNLLFHIHLSLSQRGLLLPSGQSLVVVGEKGVPLRSTSNPSAKPWVSTLKEHWDPITISHLPSTTLKWASIASRLDHCSHFPTNFNLALIQPVPHTATKI